MKKVDENINGFVIRTPSEDEQDFIDVDKHLELGLYGGYEFYSFEEVRQIRDVLNDWLASSGTVGK